MGALWICTYIPHQWSGRRWRIRGKILGGMERRRRRIRGGYRLRMRLSEWGRRFRGSSAVSTSVLPYRSFPTKQGSLLTRSLSYHSTILPSYMVRRPALAARIARWLSLQMPRFRLHRRLMTSRTRSLLLHFDSLSIILHMGHRALNTDTVWLGSGVLNGQKGYICTLSKSLAFEMG